MTPPPLFKRKVNKMKKGVQALVLMSGAASLFGVPSYFSFLPISKELKKKIKVEIPKSNPNPALPARRAQSMSVLPARNPFSSPSDELDDFAEFEAEASQFEAHRAGLLLQLEQSASSTSLPSSSHTINNRHGRYADLNPNGQEHSRYPGLASHAPSKHVPNQMLHRTQPHHPQRARRIQSAPSVALTHLSPKLLDDLDAWDTDDFTLNEWVVPEVREKAIRQQQAKPDVEDWDDDFEVDGQDELEIPNYLQSIQSKFKHDMLHMRQFALHIQDLKVIQSNVKELETSLMNHYADDIEMMKISGEGLFSQIHLLIQLADYQEDQEQHPLTKQDIEKLNTMIYHSLGQSTENLDFGEEIMTKLLGAIPPLKKELVSYVEQLRGLISL